MVWVLVDQEGDRYMAMTVAIVAHEVMVVTVAVVLDHVAAGGEQTIALSLLDCPLQV